MADDTENEPQVVYEDVKSKSDMIQSVNSQSPQSATSPQDDQNHQQQKNDDDNISKQDPQLSSNLTAEKQPVADLSDDDAVKSDDDDTLVKNLSGKSDKLTINNTKLMNKISSSHNRNNKTILDVNKIFEKGEQPKTDKKEIWAWYCYDWANSPYAGVAISLLIPLLMTDLAEEHGCNETNYGCDLNIRDIETGKDVEVFVGILELKPASYAALMIGISSLIQAVAYIFVGSIADFGHFRTILFKISSLSAGVVTSCYIFWGTPVLWQFVGWWTVLISVLHGLSVIFYNSYLPIIVETHPDVIKAVKDKASDTELKHLMQHHTDHISLIGFAFGYIGAIIVMIICLGVLFAEPLSYLESDTKYGSLNSFNNDDDIETFAFEELYARDVTEANIYYSIAEDTNNFVFINGLQFIYDGYDGEIHGSNSILTESVYFDFEGSVNKFIIYTSIDDDHICGFTFNSNDKSFNVGNITTNADDLLIKMNVISEDNLILGGMSGNWGELNTDIIISESIAISTISPLLVNIDGQFTGSALYERIGILMCGLWFIAFTLVSIKYLKDRPGPELPDGETPWLFGFKHTMKMLMKAKKYPTMFKYLISWFLFSDGVGSSLSCGILFGREVLNMSSSQLAIMVLEVYIIGTFGNYIFLKIEDKYKLSGKTMLIFHIIFCGILPFWAIIGLIPGIPFGLKSVPEMYVWVAFFSINIGSIQSFARSVFSQLIPIGHESEMFSLFEVTDKGSSWMGPLVIAAVSDTANMRWALFYVVLFFLIPLPVVWSIDMDRGRWEAGRAPQQVTRRASFLTDLSMNLDSLKDDLADMVMSPSLSSVEEGNEENNDNNDKHASQQTALEMAIDKNLTITNEIFNKDQQKEEEDDEKP